MSDAPESVFIGLRGVNTHKADKGDVEYVHKDLSTPDPLDDPRVKALVDAATEVARISDRDHVAWHRLFAALAAMKGGA